MKKGRLNKGFDIIGSIAVVKFDGKLTKKEKINAVGKILLKNKNVKVIFEKTGMIRGEERIPELKQLVGKDSVTIYKENGFSFYVDVKKVFFSPRMANERLRVIKEVKAKEKVLDMFCGVGPFAIPIAKKAARVTAIDINKHAISLLEKNIALNKISNIEYYCGDSKKIVRKLNEKFDRIIMNFPLYAYKFLGAALEKCDQKAIIHLYSFVKDKDSKDIKKKIMEDCKNHFKKVMIREYPAGEVAPYLERRCFDIKLSGVIKN